MMNYHRRIDRLDRLIAVTDEIPQLPPRQPFDQEAYDRLFAELTAAWTPEQRAAAEQWDAATAAGEDVLPPGCVVTATEQAYLAYLRERDRSRPGGAGPTTR